MSPSPMFPNVMILVHPPSLTSTLNLRNWRGLFRQSGSYHWFSQSLLTHLPSWIKTLDRHCWHTARTLRWQIRYCKRPELKSKLNYLVRQQECGSMRKAWSQSSRIGVDDNNDDNNDRRWTTMTKTHFRSFHEPDSFFMPRILFSWQDGTQLLIVDRVPTLLNWM